MALTNCYRMMLFWWGGSVPTYSLSYTLPTMVKNLGYSAVKAQALTTPPYIFATCVCVLVGVLSDKFQRRFYSIMGAYTLGLMYVYIKYFWLVFSNFDSGIVILWVTTHYPHLSGVSYFAIFLAAAGYSAQAPIVSLNNLHR